MNRTVRWHFILLAAALLDLAAFSLWAVSIRGQLPDILIMIAPFISSVAVLIRGIKGFTLPAKIYFISFTIISALLSPLYLFMLFSYPLDSYACAGRYELRECRNLMGPPAADLIKKQWVLEQDLQQFILMDDYYEYSGEKGSVKILAMPDSIGIKLQKVQGRDTTIYFKSR